MRRFIFNKYFQTWYYSDDGLSWFECKFTQVNDMQRKDKPSKAPRSPYKGFSSVSNSNPQESSENALQAR